MEIHQSDNYSLLGTSKVKSFISLKNNKADKTIKGAVKGISWDKNIRQENLKLLMDIPPDSKQNSIPCIYKGKKMTAQNKIKSLRLGIELSKYTVLSLIPRNKNK